MTLDKVIAALREGKKVKYKPWIDCKYVYIKGGSLVDDQDRLAKLCFWEKRHFYSDDWEIVEEKDI